MFLRNVFQHTTRRYILEDMTLHNHRCENLRRYWLTVTQTATSWFTARSQPLGSSCEFFSTVQSLLSTQEVTPERLSRYNDGLWAQRPWNCFEACIPGKDKFHILGQMNPVHSLLSYFFTVHLIIILTSMSRYFSGFFPSRILPRLCMHVSPVRTTCPVHPIMTATKWIRRRKTVLRVWENWTHRAWADLNRLVASHLQLSEQAITAAGTECLHCHIQFIPASAQILTRKSLGQFRLICHCLAY
jgi:hypothetical protein